MLKILGRGILAGAAGLVCHLALAGAPLAPDGSSAAVARGEYLARAGDCIACHTAPNGKPFAGGLRLDMPMLGAIFSTNITPDPQHGIGTYSYEEFDRAVRHGIAKDGHRLYPAMPFPSYARITDADMHDIYAYFMHGVQPESTPNRPSQVHWFMRMRWPLAIWSAMFARSTPFKPDPRYDQSLNRGLYLVEGLGHCGTCHTPRGIAMQEKALLSADGPQFLSGSEVGGWYARSLRGEKDTGLGQWSESDIVELLKTGRNAKSAAFGSMTEVIAHSMQFMKDSDLHAIARYLKSLPPAAGGTPPLQPSSLAQVDAATKTLLDGNYSVPGARAYAEYCLTCHRADGTGLPAVFPALAGNSSVQSPDPTSLIRIVREGGSMAVTQHSSAAYVMPAFPNLSDQQVAEILTFVRHSWGNQAAAVSASDVKKSRP